MDGEQHLTTAQVPLWSCPAPGDSITGQSLFRALRRGSREGIWSSLALFLCPGILHITLFEQGSTEPAEGKHGASAAFLEVVCKRQQLLLFHSYWWKLTVLLIVSDTLQGLREDGKNEMTTQGTMGFQATGILLPL